MIFVVGKKVKNVLFPYLSLIMGSSALSFYLHIVRYFFILSKAIIVLL